jgi:hypothetical protein
MNDSEQVSRCRFTRQELFIMCGLLNIPFTVYITERVMRSSLYPCLSLTDRNSLSSLVVAWYKAPPMNVEQFDFGSYRP